MDRFPSRISQVKASPTGGEAGTRDRMNAYTKCMAVSSSQEFVPGNSKKT